MLLDDILSEIDRKDDVPPVSIEKDSQDEGKKQPMIEYGEDFMTRYGGRANGNKA